MIGLYISLFSFEEEYYTNLKEIHIIKPKNYGCYYSLDEDRVLLEEMTRLYFYLSIYLPNLTYFKNFIEHINLLIVKINKELLFNNRITPQHYRFFIHLIAKLSTKYSHFVLNNIFLVSKIMLVNEFEETTEYKIIAIPESEIKTNGKLFFFMIL